MYIFKCFTIWNMKDTILLKIISCLFLGIIRVSSERVIETWKNTTNIKLQSKHTVFTKFSNKTFKTNHNVNIIQQTNDSTTAKCGNACQDEEQCLGFLFHRNRQSLSCLLVAQHVNDRDMDDDDGADYYEIKVTIMK